MDLANISDNINKGQNKIKRWSTSSRNVINGGNGGAGRVGNNEINFDSDGIDFLDSSGIYREPEELAAQYYRQKQKKLEREKQEKKENNKMNNKQQHSKDDLDATATKSKRKIQTNNKNKKTNKMNKIG